MLGEEQRKSILEATEELGAYLVTLERARKLTNIARMASWDVKELMLCSSNLELIEKKHKDAVAYTANLIDELHNQIEELNDGNEPYKYTNRQRPH